MFSTSSVLALGDKDIINEKKVIKISHENYKTAGAQFAQLGSIGFATKQGLFSSDRIYTYNAQPNFPIKITDGKDVTQEIAKAFSISFKIQAEQKLIEKIEAQAKIRGETLSDEDKVVTYKLLSVGNLQQLVRHISDSDDDGPVEGMKKAGKLPRIVTQIILAF